MRGLHNHIPKWTKINLLRILFRIGIWLKVFLKTYGSSSTVRNVSSILHKYIVSYNFIRRERRVEDLFLNQQKKKLQNARIDLPLDQSEVEIHLQNRHHGHMVVQQHPEQVVDALFQPRISFINHVRGLMERDGLLIRQIIWFKQIQFYNHLSKLTIVFIYHLNLI